MPEQDSIPIKFGTDGWRAPIADEFTVSNVRVCAQALCDLMIESGTASKGLMVAYDTRFGSEMFAREVTDVALGNGIPVKLTSAVTPTPAASFAVTREDAGAGVVITASHNPAKDNGFKVKSPAGGSAGPEMISQIEARIPAIYGDPSRIKSASASDIPTIINHRDTYIEAIKSFVNVDAIKAAGVPIAIDSMYGAGAGYLSSILQGGVSPITELHPEPNPAFPGMGQPEPIEQNLTDLIKIRAAAGFDVCVATDGDADRVGLVDENGRYMSTLETFSVIVHHLLSRKQWLGPVVTTVTQSTMIERICAHYGVENPRTPVGFKYVGPLMIEMDAIAGGEESGGFAYRGHVPERDGILSALLILDAVVSADRLPSELLREVQEITGPFVFDRLDLKFDPARQEEILSNVGSASPTALAGLKMDNINRLDGTRFELSEGAWALARFSGTEPLLRIYAEAPDEATRDQLISAVKSIALGE
ncbi:MAG: phosphoglucomutase/phosphomannomutase family protein [Chloroflexi bacterium]|nr:phosphoglucomutase/phosphomannomutase family protein [Chloroflexota bacterium]